VGFTLDEAIALADSAHRGVVEAGRRRGGERQRAVRRLAEAAGYGPVHQMVAVLHDDDEESGLGRLLLERARDQGAPDDVVAGLESITRRPDPAGPGGWEPYLDGLVARAATHDVGRVVKLLDGLVAMLPWHAQEPVEAWRLVVELRYVPAQTTLLAAEALRRADGLAGPFPVERGAFVRWGIALETRTRRQDPLAALGQRLQDNGGAGA
jgi:hypothetical protein